MKLSDNFQEAADLLSSTVADCCQFNDLHNFLVIKKSWWINVEI